MSELPVILSTGKRTFVICFHHSKITNNCQGSEPKLQFFYFSFLQRIIFLTFSNEYFNYPFENVFRLRLLWRSGLL
jgi:hypothetical protein